MVSIIVPLVVCSLVAAAICVRYGIWRKQNEDEERQHEDQQAREGNEKVKAFLRNIGLEEYQEKVISAGFGSMDALHTAKQDDLKFMKVGHMRKLLGAVEQQHP